MSEQYGNTPRKIQECKNGFKRKWSHYFWHEFILKNENKIGWEYLSSNPNITWDIVEAYPDKPWSWSALSINPNITWEIVEAYPDKPWSWIWLSKNPNIMKIVEAHPDKHWNWSWLSSNPNITWEIVQAYPDKPWNWNELSRNKFIKEKELFMERKLREHLVAFKIQTYWRRANYNPGYELCKRRLMKECEDLGIE